MHEAQNEHQPFRRPPVIVRRPRPRRRKHLRWELLAIPAAILAAAWILHGIEPSCSWQGILDALGIHDKPRFSSLFTLGVGQLVIPLTPAYDREQLQAAIDSIPGQGGTDMTAGLEMAFDLLAYSSRPGQVVLLTDGWSTSIHSPEPVADQLKQYAVIDCIGIAGSPGDVDECLLRYIASTNPDGTKRYRWIGDKQELIQHFHNLAGRITRR